MALITCPECSKKISDNANSCPNCGYKLSPEKIDEIKKKEHQSQIGCAALVVILVIVYIAILRLTGPSSSDENSGGTRTSIKSETIEAWAMAQQFVKDRLKSPGSAEFGSMLRDYQDPEDVVTYLGGGMFSVRGWVDSQNTFGAKIRTHFVCELERSENERWRLTSFRFVQ